MKNMFRMLVLVLLMALAGVAPVVAAPVGQVAQSPTTCLSEDYTGTKLYYCQKICESGYTGATLNMWIRRWMDRYRDLPYCLLE